MGVLQDRLVVDAGRQRLRSEGSAVTDLITRLEAGDLPAAMVRTGAISPADVVAALAVDALGGDDSPGLPLVQAKPRSPRLERVLLEPAWVAVFPGVASRSRLTLAAGLLQVYDFWDASHEAAQKADDLGERDFSAYWHGIAPSPRARREQRRLLVPPRRPASALCPASQRGPTLARPARRRRAQLAIDLRRRLERIRHDRTVHRGQTRHPA